MIHGISTALLALGYPMVYTGPVTLIRWALGDEHVVAQQLARIVYVACLMAIADVGPLPGRWSSLDHFASFPPVVDVLRYGMLPILSLFMGSMYGSLGISKSKLRLSTGRNGEQVLRDLVVAPVLEEFVFRALLTRWLVVSRGVESVALLVFLSPAIFALAHAHHVLMDIRRGMPVSMAAQRWLIQSSYTYLFGIFSSIVFLKTGSVWVCVTAHALANFFGFPKLTGLDRAGMAAHAVGLSSFLVLAAKIYTTI